MIALFLALAIAEQFETIVDGLNDPRFLSFSNGRLYVSESGVDGTVDALTRTSTVKEIRQDKRRKRDDHHDDDDDDHHERRYRVRTIVTLDSYSSSDGEGQPVQAVGAAGIAVHDGRLFVANGEFSGSDDIEALETVADSARELTFGKLIAVDLDHDDDDNEYRSYVVGNPGAAGFETQQVGIKLNVTGAFFQPEAPDTDPYGIAVDERDGTVYVANAGSNFLQAVRNGRTTTVAFFPATSTFVSSNGSTLPAFVTGTGYNLQLIADGAADLLSVPAGGDGGGLSYGGDSVPTAVAVGPDGYLYVTTLELVQSALGTAAAKIYRISPHAVNYEVSAADVWASGFKTLTDIHYSRHHNAFFVVEQTLSGFGPGAGDVVRVDIHRGGSHRDDVVAGTQTRYGATVLQAPNGVTTDDDGRIYVCDGAVNPTSGAQGTGRVLRLRL